MQDSNTRGFWKNLIYGPEPEQKVPVVPFGTGFESNVTPPARGDISLSTDAALSLTAVGRSVEILQNVLGPLPLQTFRNGELIASPLVVQKPDRDRSAESFVRRTVVCLALHGNAFWHLTRNARGEVVNVRCLNPLAVSVRYDDAGRKFYDVSLANGQHKTYDDTEVEHLRLFEAPGHDLGLSPIGRARIELTNARDARDYAANWFVTGNAVPNGVLTTDQELTGPEVEAYRAGWNQMLSDGSLAVLGKGLAYQPLALSPEDLQFLDVQKFNKTQIATLFGIPATYLLAEVDSSNFIYSNLSQISQVFYTTTLSGYASAIEGAFSNVLPNRVSVKFDLTDLLRYDDQSRYEAYKTGIEAGFLTVAEVRTKEGLPPLEETSAPAPEPTPEPTQQDAA